MEINDTLLRESILFTCGPEGLKKFQATEYKDRLFVREDGSPDYQELNIALSGVFLPEISIVIAGDYVRRIREGFNGEKMSYSEEIFQKYFSAPPDEVKDIVLEARKMRVAMGKEVAVFQRETEDNDPAVRLEREIFGFVYGSTKLSSIEIMDFTRYLRHKGYHFKDYIVLEKIYKDIEERKKENKQILEKRIEALIVADPSLTDASVYGFLENLTITGYIYDRDDVRRMIRDARLRASH